MAEAARWLEGYGVSSVDINMGCPVHKVTRGGGGSALMCDAVNTVGLVRTVVEAVRIPVTVKMRLGWDRGGSVAWQVFDKDDKPTGASGRADGVPTWSLVAAFARPGGGFTVVY